MQPSAMPDPSIAPPSSAPGADWLQIFMRFGLAAVGAFLVWKMAGSYETKLEAIDDQLRTHQQQMSVMQAGQTARDAHTLGLLRAICLGVNQRNASARALCGEP